MLGVVTDRRSLRGAALMPAAALAVHQLRYWLAFGARAPHELAAQGHAYLSTLAPWIALVAALAIGTALGRFARRWAAGGATAAAPSPRRAALRLWLLASPALVGIYSGQELLEGLLASGHPGGAAGVLGAGGWLALPAALLAGGLLALALRGERAAERALVQARPALRLHLRGRLAQPAPRMALPAPSLPAPAPLARAAAGRAPPRAAVLSPA